MLDLRHNGGGLVTSAQILAELLAPESALETRSVICNTMIYSLKTVTYKIRGGGTESQSASSVRVDQQPHGFGFGSGD